MMSQNNAIQEKEDIGSFLYTLYKNSGQISFGHVFFSILSEQELSKRSICYKNKDFRSEFAWDSVDLNLFTWINY